ncbi:hypothetical protein [Alkalihalobacillus sp. TS-13]|uniref:hypothetical protein n=1 Tax=Alkalihalobacillus sp. TS-13 TaxID=2842455 RepID=UPI001C87C631|nr:hypothetical protein [Alkalihalobacillus sp. TS-13]
MKNTREGSACSDSFSLAVFLRCGNILAFRGQTKSGSDPISHVGHWKTDEEARTKQRLGSAWATHKDVNQCVDRRRKFEGIQVTGG